MRLVMKLSKNERINKYRQSQIRDIAVGFT